MRSTQVPRANEDGYVLVMTALLMVPLLVFVAFAVDVGAWTRQATKAQNAADAAALAGAAHLPAETDAIFAARQLAEKNGFVDGVNGVTVDVGVSSRGTMRVAIGQPAEQFFSGVVLDEPINLTRAAEATALASVSMGSPTNILGFGPYSMDGSAVGGYFLIEGNRCTRGYYGDIKAARYLDLPFCSGSIPNDYWKAESANRDEGYFYVITVPPGVQVSSRLMVLDPGWCPKYGAKSGETSLRSSTPPGPAHLSFRMWDSGGTALSSHDDTPATGWWQSDECLADLPYPATEWTDQTEGWTESPFVFPPNTTGKPETHLLQTRVGPASSYGYNLYSLWVKPNDSTTSCTSIGADDCPTISAERFISLSAKAEGEGAPMDLNLAEISPQHQGRDLIIQAWDVGEQMDNVKVLAPNGDALDFTWSTDDGLFGQNNPADSCDGDPCLYLYPQNKDFPPKIPGWPTDWAFNGRLVTLTVPLDSQVNFDEYDDHWFQVRYSPIPTRAAHDWASFAVSLDGDPVRLVD